MIVMDKPLCSFSEKSVVSGFERRSSSKFYPLYDLKEMPDDLNVDNEVKSLFSLSQVWFNSFTDLFLSKYLFDDGKYAQYLDFHNIVILYCLRHSLELMMKSYLRVNDISNEDLVHSHNLRRLYDKSDLYSLFCNHDSMYKCHGNADIIREFIYWLSSYEGSNENRYRYPMFGKNPMQEDNQFVNFERIFDYTFYFSSVLRNAYVNMDNV